MSSKKTEDLHTTKDTIFYSLAGVADVMSYQMFSFYIFIFYFSVQGLDIDWVTIGFILWSIWNAINDPLLGTLSDRTASKWGRRRPWIILSLIPTCLLIVFLWTPFGDPISIFIYFLIVIMLFDTFYTMYSLNQTSLFPEMYTDLEARAKANNYVQIFNIIGLLIATLLPSLFIPEFDKPEYAGEYLTSGIIAAILFIIIALIFVRFGIKERSEYLEDAKKAPSFVESLKFTFKNRSFRTYVLANLAVWYVFGIVPVINSYYLEFVIGISSALMQSLFLAIIFVSAIVFMAFWRNVFAKHGARKAEIIALGTLLISLLPMLIVWEIIGAILAYILAGFGFAGIMFGRDVMMSTIIDADEIETGLRREASYYGVNALIIRLSTILVYISIGLVFRNIGWKIYVESVTIYTVIGLRLLMSLFPAITLSLGMLSLRRFPITKEKYEEIKVKLEKLHGEKKQSI
jgi:GPH family glycoside/pentoside/hexuronide:cation symporter